MKKNITRLGPKEAEFIARMAGKNVMIISLKEAVTFSKGSTMLIRRGVGCLSGIVTTCFTMMRSLTN